MPPDHSAAAGEAMHRSPHARPPREAAAAVAHRQVVAVRRGSAAGRSSSAQEETPSTPPQCARPSGLRLPAAGLCPPAPPPRPLRFPDSPHIETRPAPRPPSAAQSGSTNNPLWYRPWQSFPVACQRKASLHVPFPTAAGMPRFPIPRCIAGKLTAKRSVLAQAKGTAAPASRSHRAIALGIACQSLASCSGVQSALAPAAEEAEQVATLFWVMAAGGFIIWLLVVALSLYASRRNGGPVGERAAGRLIGLGGVVLPVTVLTALLSYALWLVPSLRPFAGGEGVDLRVEIVGHQFWWEVLYHRQDGSRVISANEVRLPAGERVEFELTSSDMIHSFWIPALGGKMDLVPGRINRMSFRPTKTGTYRGQCAEFCGTSHARMAFPVVVMQPADLDAWLDERSGSSAGFGTNVEGRRVFDRE